MHLIVRGERLLDTLHYNLLTKEQVKSLPNTEWGKPVWDTFPKSQGSESARVLTRSYLGRLVPLSRAILLNHESQDLTLVNGLSYPKLPASRETMAAVVVRGRGGDQRLAYIGIDLSRHPWRELESLLNLERMEEIGGGALALENIAKLSQPTVDFWVGGMSANRGKIEDVAEWNLSLPLKLLYSAQIIKYQKGVGLAKQGDVSLRNAVRAYAGYLKLDDKVSKGLRAKVNVAYWTTLDSDHKMLVDAACEPSAELEGWRSHLIRTMNGAYRDACPHETPRQIQAYALGQREIRIRKPQE
jgi:CRISPR system Cascade subunit CasA